MELETYIQYHETKIHEQPDFAYNTYLCTIPDDFKRVPLHWHEQMEIIYIKKGTGIVSVNMKPYTVSAGYVLPILPGELHSIESIPGQKMEYENIIFSLNILDNLEQNDWCRTNILHPLRSESFFFERPVLPGTSSTMRYPVLWTVRMTRAECVQTVIPCWLKAVSFCFCMPCINTAVRRNFPGILPIPKRSRP